MSHEDICKELTATYNAKNHDYGDAFSKTVSEFGLVAALVRISDKYYRLVNLVKSSDGPMVADESIRDTLLDMANYCIMTAMEVDK
jgi:hypothetical protein